MNSLWAVCSRTPKERESLEKTYSFLKQKLKGELSDIKAKNQDPGICKKVRGGISGEIPEVKIFLSGAI